MISRKAFIQQAKDIYTCWNWDMLEAQMESGYDQGAFRDLVEMYKKMVDALDSPLSESEGEAKRLRAALERIANFGGVEYSESYYRIKEIARKALEGSTSDGEASGIHWRSMFEISEGVLNREKQEVERLQRIVKDAHAHIVQGYSPEMPEECRQALIRAEWQCGQALSGSSTSETAVQPVQSDTAPKTARERIAEYIAKSGYTYTVDDIVEAYMDNFKNGWYVSHTTRDCIENLTPELEEICSGIKDGREGE